VEVFVFVIATVCLLNSQVALAQSSGHAFVGVPRVAHEQMWISSPDPAYPPGASRKHLGGKGLFRLTIDPQKRTVTHVTVVESTGSKLLDDAAVRGLSQWHMRRGGLADKIDHLDVPVTFTP
jgi:TonB family protein